MQITDNNGKVIFKEHARLAATRAAAGSNMCGPSRARAASRARFHMRKAPILPLRRAFKWLPAFTTTKYPCPIW